MKVILQIGYERVVVPSEKGVQTLLNVLSKARPVKYRSPGDPIVIEDDRNFELSMAVVPDGTPIVLKSEVEAMEHRDEMDRRPKLLTAG